MTNNHSNDSHFSRRRFMQIMAGASLATATGTLAGCSSIAKPAASNTMPVAAPKRTVPLPKINVRTSAPAAERYQFQPNLKRFKDQHQVWKDNYRLVVGS